MQANSLCVLVAVSLALSVQKEAVAYTDFMRGCKLPTKFDDVIGYSPLYGHLDPGDVVWHNEEWAYRQYGPISKFVLYKAWFYDGAWHDPGEWKGLQTWYGQGAAQRTHDDKLLFGARRPHVPKEFTLYRDEVLVRAELEWDTIMRWANFTSSLGRYFAWGFPNATPGVKKAVVQAPPGAYIGAFRGFEGKPLPKELGGHKKRYISQNVPATEDTGFVWARRDCPTTKSAVTEGSRPVQRQPAVQRKPAAVAATSSKPAEEVAASVTRQKPTAATAPAKPAAAAPAAGPTRATVKPAAVSASRQSKAAVGPGRQAAQIPASALRQP